MEIFKKLLMYKEISPFVYNGSIKINSSKIGHFEELFEGHFQSQNIEDGFKLFTRKINNISKPQKLLHINGIEKHEFGKMPLEEQKKHLESELKTRDTNLFKYTSIFSGLLPIRGVSTTFPSKTPRNVGIFVKLIMLLLFGDSSALIYTNNIFS